MAHVLVRHKVKDFDKWKPVYDEHAKTRKAAGSKGGHLYRSEDDPSEVIVFLEFSDLAKAREFARSADLKEAMQRAGVADQPDIYFLNEAGRSEA